MLTIALIEPQIPPNTGNIARLCGATNTRLEIVGEIGFKLSDKYLRRAGLDYWEHVNWEYFEDIDLYFENLPKNRVHLLTTKASVSYTERCFKSGDYLLFGSETKGIRAKYMDLCEGTWCTIPMMNPGIRSLNLSTSAGIVLYEALRQIG